MAVEEYIQWITEAYRDRLGALTNLEVLDTGGTKKKLHRIFPWPPLYGADSIRHWAQQVGEQMGDHVQNRYFRSFVQTTPADKIVRTERVKAEDSTSLYNNINHILGDHGSYRDDPVFLVGAVSGLGQGLRVPSPERRSTIKLLEEAYGPTYWIPQKIKDYENDLMVVQGGRTRLWVESDKSFTQPLVDGPYLISGAKQVAVVIHAGAGVDNITIGAIPLEEKVRSGTKES